LVDVEENETFIERLRAEIDLEVLQLQAVATHQSEIELVNDEYRARRVRIHTGLQELGLVDPNEWPDLWLWYEHAKQTYDTYLARRTYAIRLYQSVRDSLERLPSRSLGTGLESPETGWAEVDRQSVKLRSDYVSAQTCEDFQAVGLLCREILISVGQATFDPVSHLVEGETPPKASDAKTRLMLVLSTEAPGESNSRLRKHVRSMIETTWDFAVSQEHDRKSTLTKTAILVNATLHLIDALRRLVPKPTGGGAVVAAYAEFADDVRADPHERMLEQSLTDESSGFGGDSFLYGEL
jgi:hypothetical protein